MNQGSLDFDLDSNIPLVKVLSGSETFVHYTVQALRARPSPSGWPRGARSWERPQIAANLDLVVGLGKSPHFFQNDLFLRPNLM